MFTTVAVVYISAKFGNGIEWGLAPPLIDFVAWMAVTSIFYEMAASGCL